MVDRHVSLWSLNQAALPLLLFGQLEVSVRQDASQRAEDPQCLSARREKDRSEKLPVGLEPEGCWFESSEEQRKAHLVE